MRFAKVVKHARTPEKMNPTDPGVTLFSAENFKLEYGETHAFRTGVVLEIPEGSFGLLAKKMDPLGVVAGQILTANNSAEVRVSMQNNHRNALEVQSGMPLCQLVIMEDNFDEEMEEFYKEGLVAEIKAAAAE